MENPVANNVRVFREAKKWTQAELAIAASLSERTVQRIESGGPAGLETLRSLASAFDTDVDTLQMPPPSEQELAEFKKKMEKLEVVKLEPMLRGSDIGRILEGGSHAMCFETIRLNDDAQEDLVAELRQDLRDWGDLWSELEPIQRRDAEKGLSRYLGLLAEKGLQLGAGSHVRQLRLKPPADTTPFTWNIIYFYVYLKSEPKLGIIVDKSAPISFGAG